MTAATTQDAAADAPVQSKARRRNPGFLRRNALRLFLLVVLPAAVVVGGVWLYLTGGRYVGTDNAYVGAQKVLITPEISGQVVSISAVEGQLVHKGDPLFSISADTYQSAVKQAEAQVQQARSDYLNLKATLQTLTPQMKLAQEVVDARRAQLAKNKTLVARGVTAQDAMNDWTVTVATAETQLAQLTQQQSESLARLMGNPDLPLEQYPAYMQAEAGLDKARRDLDHTQVRAPMDGIATQVTNIQVGRFLNAGTPVLAVVDAATPWVDANPKETDLTYVVPGQPVTITVDTFPDRSWHGTVQSISPGTGAQFSILPPQNASGNWVKVVQRVPVRIAFAAGEDTRDLRAGLSVYVSIDTGRTRTLAGLLGVDPLHGTATAATTLGKPGS